MSTCTVANASSIYCDTGCCGTESDRKCCEYELSEEIIIVICVVGTLFVVAVVAGLIICLTSKHKDRVTPITPTERRRQIVVEPARPRHSVFPKLPPYSEAPPLYESVQTPVDLRPSPSSTDPILPGTVEDRVRVGRRTRVAGNRRQTRNQPRRRNEIVMVEQPSDPPPSYVSVINMESPFTRTDRHFNQPSTSSMTPIEDDNRHNSVTPTIEIIDRTTRSSPHPSLASGHISMAGDNDRSHRLHRTVSERSPFVTPLPTLGEASVRNLGSVTPVTIREITVHSHHRMQNINEASETEHSGSASIRNKGALPKNTKIPRPVQRVKPSKVEYEREELSEKTARGKRKRHISLTEPHVTDANGAGTRNVQDDIGQRQNQKRKHSINDLAKTNFSEEVTINVFQTNNKRNRRHETSPDDNEITLEDLSTNLKPSAAARREQRRAILERLRERQQITAPDELE